MILSLVSKQRWATHTPPQKITSQPGRAKLRNGIRAAALETSIAILGRPTQTISFPASGKRLETPIPPQRTTLLLGRVA